MPSPWEDFHTFGNKALGTMLGESKDFAEKLCTPLASPYWLTLAGSSGAGKTMLAKIILAHAREFARRFPYLEQAYRIRRVQYATWTRAADRLRDGDFDQLEDLKKAWCVVLDDVGAEHDGKSNFVTSKLYDLLNSRLGKWTVLTSNFSLEEIGTRLDARIASRLRRDGGVVVEVDVPDYATRDRKTLPAPKK